MWSGTNYSYRGLQAVFTELQRCAAGLYSLQLSIQGRTKTD